MERTRAMLLEVWRQACRHIEIDVSVGDIAAVVARWLPIDRLGVYRLDATARTVEPIAMGGADGATAALHPPIEPAPASWKALRHWCDGQRLAHRHIEPQAPPFVALTGDVDDDRDRLAAPLDAADGSVGLLVLIAPPTQTFTARDAAMFDALREPMTIALDNDLRVRELIALRESAEADKRLLLRRLGRSQLIDPIVGVESGLAPVMRRVDLVARSSTPVLLLGETGSGKEVIARAIHERGPHPDRPFIRVNCGAIPSELIDSELFGHEKGAFTGATTQRRGWFERADGGTLLLDEIGELPLAAQLRLLRVLQDGTFERVGGEQSIHVHVRIIAATHRDLPAMVQQGGFREDLWYRVAVFPIVIPPLRERRDDIAMLAEHFAERAARRLGLRPQRPTERDIAMLRAYDWPGNVRELAAVIDRAAILGDGAALEIAAALGGQVEAPARRPGPADEPDAPILSLDEAACRHIEAALQRTRGRVDGPDGAARLLRINPNTLRSRMRKFRIDASRFRPTPEANGANSAVEPAQ